MKRILKIGLLVFFGGMAFAGFFGTLVYVSENKVSVIRSKYVRALLPAYYVVRDAGKMAANAAYIPRMVFGAPDMPEYELFISRKNLRKLEEALPRPNSPEVLSGTFFFSEELRKDVPARFVYDGEEYDVKVRYRGLNPNHWTRKKRSWQVIFDKEDLFEGKKVLKLILPDDRGYFTEMLNNYRSQKLGVAAPAAWFAKVKINGSGFGVYYATEDFSKAFLETSGLPADVNLYTTDDEQIASLPYAASIFENQWLLEKETESGLFDFSNFGDAHLLTSIAAGDPASPDALSRLLDLENFYAWNTVAMLAGSVHQGDAGNVRMFLNTTNGAFEFLSWDVGLDSSARAMPAHALAEILFESSHHALEQKKSFWKYVKDEGNLADDLRYYDDLYEKYKTAFYRDWVKYDANGVFDAKVAESRRTFEGNFRHLKKLFKDDDVRAFVLYDGSKNLVTVRFGVRSYAGLALSSIAAPVRAYARGSLYYDADGDGVFSAAKDELMAQSTADGPGASIKFRNLEGKALFSGEDGGEAYAPYTFFILLDAFGGDAAPDIEGVDASFTNLVTGEAVGVGRMRFGDTSTFSHLAAVSLSPREFAARHPAFRIGAGGVVLPSGTHVFSRDVVVPEGTRLTVAPGSSVYFAPGVSLVSYSPVTAKGAKYAPITFRSLSSGDPWGVFGVVDTARGRSVFENVHFSGGSGDYINGVLFSGMLSAYHADISVAESFFRGARDDDALNVKYADVDIRENVFEGNSADALDLDFAEGTVRGNTFRNSGNDGIDISGSDVLISENFIAGSADKCLSIGERSESPVVFNNVLVRCGIGIETKDASTPLIINNVIAENRIGLNAYRKKAFFKEGGFPRVYNSIIWGNEVHKKDDAFSKTVITSSAVEGGSEGEGNAAIDPHLEEVGGSYEAKSGDPFFENGGTVSVLKNVLESEIEKAPIGLFD